MAKTIKSILTNVLNMTVPAFAFDGRDKIPTQEGEVCIRSTLLEAIYGTGDFAILKACRHPEVEREVFNYKLECILAQGIEPQGQRFKALGAGSSLKDGKLWLGTEQAISCIHRYFNSSQEALSYFGVFTSGCYHGIHQLEFDIRVVPDGELGTADGQGFIPAELAKRLTGQSEVRQLQVRLIAEDWLAKGTLMPYSGDVTILPDSMIKGKGMPVSGTEKCWIGIRDIGQSRVFNSNFTILQWFDEPTIDRLLPGVEAGINDLEGVLISRDRALKFLGSVNGSEDRNILESFLKAGVPPTHRWLHSRLKELVRKRVVSLSLGGAIDLKGGMAAYLDLPANHIACVDIPAGPCVVSRYPVRDRLSFLPAINDPTLCSKALSGSIYINNTDILQLDGDFDGDYLVVTQDPAILDTVWNESWLKGYKRLPESAKRRKSDPLSMLPYSAVEAMGNRVGYITYLITTAVLNDREDVVPALSQSLQNEVQGIKWDTKADFKLISKLSDELEIPTIFRDLNNDQTLFVSKLPEVDAAVKDKPLFKCMDLVIRKWQGVAEIPRDLPCYKYQVPIRELPDQVITETRSVAGLYNSWISELIEESKDEDPDLSAPIEFIRQWGESKTENAADWATALWHIVHSSRSSISTGSAAFNSMQETMVCLIQNRPLEVAEQGENIHRNNLLSVPCVGGHYDIPGSSYFQRAKGFAEAVKQIGRMANINVIQNPLDKNGLDFIVGEFRLGSLPRDYQDRCSLTPGAVFTAYITHCGRALYLHIIQ